MKIHARLVLNKAHTISRFDPKYQQAQKFLDSAVVKGCSPYVPMKKGGLMRSGENATKLGSGRVIYNTPYARRMYYGLNYNFSKDLHPQASAQWFEKGKAVELKSWTSGVDKIIRG